MKEFGRIAKPAVGCLLIAMLFATTAHAQRKMERLDRGVVAVSTNSGNYVGWRMFGTEDPASTGFNVYRDGIKLNAAPITTSTNFMDGGGTPGSTYAVSAVESGVEKTPSDPVTVRGDYHWEIPLQRPPGGTTPDGFNYSYSPNDTSVGDLDGDGQYELVLKWKPSNAKDNAQSGYTGNTILDAYEMDGTFLWRIDLGINIRSGEHYTQFMVYDLDGDGRAEMVCKTADGSTDGTGTVLGDAAADWRNGSGYVLSGPEYLSVFDGQTGAFVDTVDYVPARGNVSSWGDNYGNRVDRLMACVAYLDGTRPSVVATRGIYTRSVLAAWDFIGGELVQRWVFDTNAPGNSAYAGQGNHNLSVADVDADGRDEIVYGSMCVDDDGTGLYSTGLGHGDALHVSDMDPDRPGLEVWMPHETSANGATFRDAATGEIIFDDYNSGDIGRGVAAHIDPDHFGYQMWSTARSEVYDVDGNPIGGNHTGKMWGFVAWWTADLQREFLGSADGAGKNPVIEKWGGSGPYRYNSIYNAGGSYATNGINGTKANPCFSGDILGDWREELIYHSADNTKLRIFTTTEVTSHRIHTLVHDPQYRVALAWQNVGYNQPPHPSFYIGEGMSPPPTPNIIYAGDLTPPAAPSGLTASADGSLVSLSWNPNDDPDLGGYRIYRAESPGGFYEFRGSVDGSETRFRDGNAADGETYHYVVAATDTSGNVGAYSNEVAVTAGPGLIVHYRMDGDAVDGSGNRNDAASEGSPNYPAGVSGQALDFDGSNDRATLPPGIFNGDEISIATWVWWDGGGNWQRIFDFGNGTGEYLFLTPQAGGGGLRFAIKDGGDEQRLDAPALATGQWVHVAVTLGSSEARLYVDGVSVDTSGAITIKPSDFDPTANFLGDSQFGADPFFDGRLDEFHVFNYALSGSEVAVLAGLAAPAAPTSLVATPNDRSIGLAWTPLAGAASYEVRRSITTGGSYATIATGWTGTTYDDSDVSPGITYHYVVSARNAAGEGPDSDEASATTAIPSPPHLHLRFDETSGTLARDATGNGWDGALVDGAAFAAGRIHNGVSLDGSDDHVTLAAGVVGSLDDFTASAWVYWDGGSSDWVRILDFGNGPEGSYLFLTPRNGSTGTVRFAITTAGPAGEEVIDGSAALPTGAWTHVAVTLSGGTGRLYVNGSEVGSNPGMTLTPASLGSTAQNYLGRSQFAADPYFDGFLDEFQIHARALPAGEIAELAAPPAAPAGLLASAGEGQVELDWNPVTDADRYAVKRATTPGGPYTLVAANVPNPAFLDTGLTNGSTYHYVVTALMGVSESGPSAEASVTPLTALQAWRLEHFETTANTGDAADDADPDGDGMKNIDEFNAGTDPGDSSSRLAITELGKVGGNFVLSFPTVEGKTYRVDCSPTMQPGSWEVVLTDGVPQDSIAGTGGTIQVTDTGSDGQPVRIYRVEVR